MSLSVDDILSDLAKLQPTQTISTPSSSSSSRHALLSLGHSLLPATLQSVDTDKGIASISSSSSGPSIDDLHNAISRVDQEKSQRAALHLSSVYLESARNLLALNQDESYQTHDDLTKDQAEKFGLFDDLHRRVAKLQSSNDGYINKLQETRLAVAGNDVQQ